MPRRVPGREQMLTPEEEASKWLESVPLDPDTIKTALGGLVRSRVLESDGLTVRDCRFLKAVADSVLARSWPEDLATLQLCGNLTSAVEVSLAEGIVGSGLTAEVKGALDLPKAE